MVVGLTVIQNDVVSGPAVLQLCGLINTPRLDGAAGASAGSVMRAAA